jgi:hypothetical protein
MCPDSTKFETRGAPAPEEALAEFEQLVGMLPNDYRNFLAEGDGARLKQFNTIVGSEFGGVREVFALADTDGSYRKLPGVLKTYQHRIPAGFVPIADDQAGNLYLLGIAPPHAGQVFFWDHEAEADEGEEPTFDNVYRVAISFKEFIDRVRLDND